MNVFLLFHLVSIAIGAGAVFTHDYLLARAVMNPKLSSAYVKYAPLISDLIWFGYGLLILTGYFLSQYNGVSLFSTPWLVTKLVLIGLIGINGYVLNQWAFPKVAKLTEQDWADRSAAFQKAVIAGIPFGAASTTLWLSTITMGALQPRDTSVFVNLLIVFSVWILATIGGRIGASLLFQRSR